MVYPYAKLLSCAPYRLRKEMRCTQLKAKREGKDEDYYLKVRGAGLPSQLLFPMLDRPHLSSIPMLGRKHQLVDVFKAT